MTVVSKSPVLTLVLALLLAGCSDFGGSSDDDKSSVGAPSWDQGRYWIYTFTGPDFEEVITRIVVSGEDPDGNYLLGAASEPDAQLHAVLNLDPVLGRVTTDGFAVYENGETQYIFQFPLRKGKEWQFDFLGYDGWEARVTDMDEDSRYGTRTTVVKIHAENPDGYNLDYHYDSKAKWIRWLELSDPIDAPMVTMTLSSFGTGYTGDTYFYRARDVFDTEYHSTSSSPVVDIFDTFIDSGHPKYGAWDVLVYHLDIESASNGGGFVNLRDRSSTTQMTEVIDSDTDTTKLGTVPSENGNWTVVVELDGTVDLHVRIAGAIIYSYTVDATGSRF